MQWLSPPTAFNFDLTSAVTTKAPPVRASKKQKKRENVEKNYEDLWLGEAKLVLDNYFQFWMKM